MDNHYYAVVPNGSNEYMIEWCTETKEGTYSVPTPTLREDLDGIWGLLINWLDMSYDNAVLVAKVLSKGKYPVWTYKRVSDVPESDDYWTFDKDKEITIRQFVTGSGRQMTELDLTEKILKGMKKHDMAKDDINEHICSVLETTIKNLERKGILKERC